MPMFATKPKFIYTIFFSLIAEFIFSQQINFHKNKIFENFNINQGLSENTINCIAQDSLDFIWLGTLNGLNRYDGEHFFIIQNQFQKKDILASNLINCILPDSKLNLWIGTRYGLSCYNIPKHTFKTFHIKHDSIYAPENTINSLCEDKNGNIWLATNNELYYYNTQNNTISKFRASNKTDYDFRLIKDIKCDKNNNLWFISVGQGLFVINQNINTITSIKSNNKPIIANCLFYNKTDETMWIGENLNSIYKIQLSNNLNYIPQKIPIQNFYINQTNENKINCLTILNNTELWIGTNNGLWIYNQKTNQTEYYNTLQNNKPENDIIISLFTDKMGDVWIGTFCGGLYKYNNYTNRFFTFKISVNNADPINSNYIRCFTSANQNNFWVGTQNGLYFFERSNSGTKFEQKNITLPKEFKSLFLWDLKTDSYQNLWLATNNDGLICYNLLTKKQSVFNKDNGYFKTNSVRYILVENTDTLWIGTLGDGISVLIKNRKTGIYEKQKNFVSAPNNLQNTLAGNHINQIFKDKKGKYWIATAGYGLSIYDKHKNQFITFKTNKNDSNTITSNFISCIFEDRNNNIWIGTLGGGLLKYSSKINKFQKFDFKDNKINSVYGILADSLGNIWISTNNGIAEIKLKNQFFNLFTNNDGIQNFQFNLNATIKLASGELLFGQIHGFNLFNPGTFATQSNPPKLYFTDFKIFETSINPDSIEKTISQSILFSDQINLKHTQNFFTIQFSALKFSNYKQINYKYKLENFDKDWNTTNNHEVSYTNLEPGVYTFRVKAINSDWINNIPEKSIKIIISPPFYKTWLFKTIIYVSIAFLIGIFILLRAINSQKKKQNLNRLIDIRTNQLLAQKNEIEEINIELEEHQQELYQKSIQLKEANEKLSYLSLVASKTDNSIIIMDSFGNFEWVNEGFTRLYGYTIDDIKQKKLNNFIDLSVRKNASEILNTCIATKESINYESFAQKDTNTKIWVQTTLTPILDNENNILKIIAIESDISEIKKAEQEILQKNEEINLQKETLEQKNEEILRQSDELHILSWVASKTDNSIIIMDEKGNFEWVNDGFQRLYKISFEEFIANGKNFRTGSTKINANQILDIVIDTKESVNYESFVPRGENDKIWVQTTLTPILDEYRNLIKIIAIESDISMLKKAEQEILQKNEEIRAQRDSLEQQNEEIMAQRDEVRQKNKLIHAQNEQIKGSIRTAFTIQNAILPSKDFLDTLFESFIIYRPKDIVSGDFYWVGHLPAKNELTEKIFIAVVDCTGHGVPGAFMSMIGNILLNVLIFERKIFKPELILEHLNIEIKKAFRQKASDNTDGMDVVLCYIEKKEENNFVLDFCGAHRPLYLLKSESNNIIILEGNKKTIGGPFAHHNNIGFKSITKNLRSGDSIYLSTDGIIDQIGNETKKRFGSTGIIKIIEQNAHLSISEQGRNIELALDNWQQEECQRDDITILGIKF